MTKRLQISIPKENPYAFTSCALMAASGIIRLWHYLPGEMDAFTLWIHLIMPVAASVIFLAGMIAGGRYSIPAVITALVLGVAFFIIKATTFSPVHQALCTVLYLSVLFLFGLTVLGYLPTKKLLYPLFSLPLIYHITVEDTQLYFFADPPVPVWEWMPEISVLCIMAGLLCLSIALEAKPVESSNRR